MAIQAISAEAAKIKVMQQQTRTRHQLKIFRIALLLVVLAYHLFAGWQASGYLADDPPLQLSSRLNDIIFDSVIIPVGARYLYAETLDQKAIDENAPEGISEDLRDLFAMYAIYYALMIIQTILVVVVVSWPLGLLAKPIEK